MMELWFGFLWNFFFVFFLINALKAKISLKESGIFRRLYVVINGVKKPSMLSLKYTGVLYTEG